MRLDRFDLNLLVFLDGLLAERNVTRAGARISIGQSAASAALARLREHFGDPLLEQVGRRMMLTPLARDLIEPVRAAVLAARAALALRPGFDPATATRRFRVIASDYAVEVFLQEAIRWMYQRAPGVALEIVCPAPGMLEAVDRGDIDLMILPCSIIPAHTLASEPLFEDRQVAIVWTGNSRVRDALDGDLYSALGHVAVRMPGARSSAGEDRSLQSFQRARRIEVVVDRFSAMAPLIVGTMRTAIVPGRLAARQAEYLPVRVLSLPFDSPPLVECMQWRSALDRDPAHLWLRSVLRDTAARLPVPPPGP